MKLYEIATDCKSMLDDLSEDFGEKEFNILLDKFNYKADSVLSYCLNLKAQAEMIKEHCDKLSLKRKTLENKAERLIDYVKLMMEKIGINAIHDRNGLFTAKIALNPPSVNIVNQADIPSEYIITKTEQSVDKKSILQNFRDTGEVVAGVDIVRTSGLRIK